MQRLHLHHRLRCALAAVVAGEFAERAFLRGVAGMQHTFDHQFGVGGDRQADAFGVGEFDRPAHHAARDLEFGFLHPEHLRGEHEQHRVDAIGSDHFARLAARPPGVAVEPAMLAGGAVDPDPPRPVQHLAIAADVDPAGVGMRRQA